MRFLLPGLAILAWAVEATDLVGKVVNLHDGDTLTLLVSRQQIKVRLVDIDAPELKQPFGRRSKQSLSKICGGKVALVDDRGKDRYSRTLGQVACIGIDASAEQVRRGMAWVYVQYAPKGSPLYVVQTEARVAKRGLWQDAGAMPPWEWRRRK